MAAAAASYAKLPKRIQKEIEIVQTEAIPGIMCAPMPNNGRHFDLYIQGPGDSPFEGGVFRLEMFLPANFPIEPPKARFLTRIYQYAEYNPNVDAIGRICLDILKDKWSPALRLTAVCLSLQSLLASPNPDDPLDNNVANVWKSNPRQANATAREWTRKYAMV